MSEPARWHTLYDREVRAWERRATAPGTWAETDGPVVRILGGHRGFVAGAPDLGLDGPAIDRLIARQRELFAARGEAVEWKTWAHDRPESLADRLTAAGFEPEEQETVMVAAPGDLVATDDVPPGVVVRPVTARADLDRLARFQSAVYGEELSWLAADLAARADGEEELTVLVAESDDEVVGAAWMTRHRGAVVAGLWGGATATHWRRRGVYRALVTRRARWAAGHGVTCLHVDASADSRPVLANLGFEAITTTTPYVWRPTAHAAQHRA